MSDTRPENSTTRHAAPGARSAVDPEELCQALERPLTVLSGLVEAAAAADRAHHSAQLRTLLERVARQAAAVQALADVALGPPLVPAARPPAAFTLTTRESEVLTLVGEGLASKEIAHRLGITPATVRTHVQNILTKLGVCNRRQAAALLAGRLPHAARPRPYCARLTRLTGREIQVLRCLAAGLGRCEIAERLYVSPHTARTHIQRVLSKLGVHSALAAMAVARDVGLAPSG